MSSTKLSLKETYTINGETLTGEEISKRLEMYDKMYEFIASQHARVHGGK